MDAIDRTIIKLLLEDGRASYQKLSAASGLSATAVAERVARLRAAGDLGHCKVLLNRRLLGRGISLYAEVTLTQASPHALQTFRDAATTLAWVEQVYIVGGAFDVLLKLYVCPPSSWLYITTQLLALPQVRETRTYPVIDEFKGSCVDAPWPAHPPCSSGV